MRVCDAAVAVLRETDNPAVMWGDSGLLHTIAARMGWKPNGHHTEARVLEALSRTPGKLIRGKTFCAGRWVRIFRLPQE